MLLIGARSCDYITLHLCAYAHFIKSIISSKRPNILASIREREETETPNYVFQTNCNFFNWNYIDWQRVLVVDEKPVAAISIHLKWIDANTENDKPHGHRQMVQMFLLFRIAMHR